MDLVRESRFKNSFIFKYSERPGTKGAELYADDVPDEVKRRRNNELLALQNEISEEDNHAFLGREVRCWSRARASRPSGRPPTWRQAARLSVRRRAACGHTLQLTGRTHCDRIVVFDGNRAPDRPDPADRRSTTPTPTRCSAKSSRGTSGAELFTLTAPDQTAKSPDHRQHLTLSK